MQRIRLASIGMGARGGLLQHAHRPDNGSAIVALADIHAPCRAKFLERYGADAFVTDDYRRLLDHRDIDAVFVLSPDYLHEEHAIAALEAGKVVYLEKPMAITLGGCDRILETACRTKGRLLVGHNMRHHAVVRKMREVIQSGAIGEVQAGWCRHFVGYGGDFYFKDWHAERAKTTGLLLQKASHDLDVLHWLCGGYTTRAAAFGNLRVYNRIRDRHDPSERGDYAPRLENWPPLSQKGMNPVIDVEDLSMMLMELDNGVMCSYQQCHYTPDVWRNYTIIGTEGRIENFGDRPGECVVRLWNRRTLYNPYGDEQYFVPAATGGHGGADPLIVSEFLSLVRGGTITISPIAARNSVAAGYLATQSLRSGGTPMDVPPASKKTVEYFERFMAKDSGLG